MAEASTAQNQIPVVDRYGNFGTLDPSEAQDAFGSGAFSPATPDQIAEFQNNQKYGEGLGNSLKAFGAGAARSASFGLSDEGLTKLGVDPNTLQQLKERHGLASGLGEAAGIVGSLAVAPEASPVGLLSRAGRGVAEAAAPAAEGLASLAANAETSPAINAILSKAGSHALGSSVEGAAYGLGQSVSENALGDPNLNGEKIMANIGHGALLGGALGGVLTAGELALPKAVEQAGHVISKTYEFAKGAPEETGPLGNLFSKASSFVSGNSEETITDAIKSRALAIQDPSEKAKMAEGFVGVLNDQYQTIQKELKTTFKDIRPEETNSMLKDMDPSSAQNAFKSVNDNLAETISQMEARPALYPEGIPTKLKMIQEDFQKSITPESNASDVFSAINELKQNLDTRIKFGKIPTAEYMDSIAALKDLRGSIKNSLENENVWGPAGARQSAFNDAYNSYLTNLKQFRKSFMYKSISKSGAEVYQIDPSKVVSYFQKIGTPQAELRDTFLSDFMKTSQDLTGQIAKSYEAVPSKTFDQQSVNGLLAKNQQIVDQAVEQARVNKLFSQLGAGAHNTPLLEGGALLAGIHAHPAVGAALETWNMMRAPGLAIQRMAKIERMTQSISQSIENGAKAIFKFGDLSPTLKDSKVYSGFLGSKLSDVSSFHDQARHFDKVATQVNQLQNDPEKMIDTLTDSTRDLYPIAPNTTESVHQAASRATSFLSSKLPQLPPKKPLSPKYDPSQSEMSKFNRYFSVVESPVSVLEQVKTGTLTPEAIETLSTVYPKLYSEMKQSVLEHLTNHLSKKENLIPYKTKLGLSLFLEQDLDNSLDPFSIQSNQAMMAGMGTQQANQDAKQHIKTSQEGLSKLNLSQRMLTTEQASNQRAKA